MITASSSNSSTAWTCGTRIGMTLVAESFSLSLVAVVVLLSYLGFRVFRDRHESKRIFIRSHLDLYFLGLLFSDLIQAMAGVMNIRWVAINGVFEGSYCTAQGVLEQFGDVGVALCSMAIAMHTFAEIVLRWKEPRKLWLPVVVLILYAIFLSLITGVGYATHRQSRYYGDTIYWCWIRKPFIGEGIGLEYAWMWLAAVISLLFYIPVFLTLQKIIVVQVGDRWLDCRVVRVDKQFRLASPVSPHRMLYYPAIYIVTVLPVGIVRISQFTNGPPPFPATVFADILFSLSGFSNVILYSLTRPALLRPPDKRPSQSPGNGHGIFASPDTVTELMFRDRAIQAHGIGEGGSANAEHIPRYRTSRGTTESSNDYGRESKSEV